MNMIRYYWLPIVMSRGNYTSRGIVMTLNHGQTSHISVLIWMKIYIESSIQTEAQKESQKEAQLKRQKPKPLAPKTKAIFRSFLQDTRLSKTGILPGPLRVVQLNNNNMYLKSSIQTSSIDYI